MGSGATVSFSDTSGGDAPRGAGTKESGASVRFRDGVGTKESGASVRLEDPDDDDAEGGGLARSSTSPAVTGGGRTREGFTSKDTAGSKLSRSSTSGLSFGSFFPGRRRSTESHDSNSGDNSRQGTRSPAGSGTPGPDSGGPTRVTTKDTTGTGTSGSQEGSGSTPT